MISVYWHEARAVNAVFLSYSANFILRVQQKKNRMIFVYWKNWIITFLYKLEMEPASALFCYRSLKISTNILFISNSVYV